MSDNLEKSHFGPVVTAMITPFDQEGDLDIDGAVSLAKWLTQEQKNDALVIAGTTGEGPVLSDSEKADLWSSISQAVTVPVIANSGTNDTRHSIELTKIAASCGVAGILAVTPYYNRPSQSGIETHFTAIAQASNLPVLLYDIPVRTGRKIDIDTIIKLIKQVPNIIGVKDATSNPALSARLIAQAPTGFELYSGDDSFTLPLLAVGAVGVIGVATHWAAKEHSEMISAFLKGEITKARAINAALLESFSFETSDEAPNPIPAKTMMRVMGLAAGQCRPPLGIAPLWLQEQAKQVLEKLKVANAEISK
jgi:4-hydroxy-tetrahydrodipicolinate synthase